MHNAGQGCTVTHGDRILRQRAGRQTGVNWLLWIFWRWRLRRNKNMCAHAVILTPLSLPDLRVIEVRCVILMNKSHTDTLLDKMREGKYISCYCSPFMKQYVRNRERQRRRLGVSSTCFQLKRPRKRPSFTNLKIPKKVFCLSWNELLSLVQDIFYRAQTEFFFYLKYSRI